MNNVGNHIEYFTEYRYLNEDILNGVFDPNKKIDRKFMFICFLLEDWLNFYENSSPKFPKHTPLYEFYYAFWKLCVPQIKDKLSLVYDDVKDVELMVELMPAFASAIIISGTHHAVEVKHTIRTLLEMKKM